MVRAQRLVLQVDGLGLGLGDERGVLRAPLNNERRERDLVGALSSPGPVAS